MLTTINHNLPAALKVGCNWVLQPHRSATQKGFRELLTLLFPYWLMHFRRKYIWHYLVISNMTWQKLQKYSNLIKLDFTHREHTSSFLCRISGNEREGTDPKHDPSFLDILSIPSHNYQAFKHPTQWPGYWFCIPYHGAGKSQFLQHSCRYLSRPLPA